jgi:hypothetical protein
MAVRVFRLRYRVGWYVATIMGFLVLASAVTLSTPSLAQQNSGTGTVSTPPPKASVANKGSTSTAKRASSPRQKRGGPESSPGNDINATPAEGQSDLIKVLQPGSRQIKK